MRRRLHEEAIALFDGTDTGSFDDIYKGREDLFEDVDSLINPKFRKLFEAVYQTGNLDAKRLRLRENDASLENDVKDNLDETKDEIKESVNEKIFRECNVTYAKKSGGSYLDAPEMTNRVDGIPGGHNPQLSKGPTSKVRQSGARLNTNKGLNEQFSHIFKECNIPPGGHYDSGRESPAPSGDGVNNAHNPALSKGPTSEVTQSGARQDDSSKLGSEPPLGDSHKKSANHGG